MSVSTATIRPVNYSARLRQFGRLLGGGAGSVKRPIVFLIITLIISSFLSSSFLTVDNIKSLLISSSFLMVITVGEAFVIMMGMIDLGVESILAASGMIVAFLTVYQRMPAIPAVLITLAIGVLIGITVGLLVTKGRIPSFIVTLGSYWGFAGVALLVNNGSYISPFSVTPTRALGFGSMAGATLGISRLILLSFGVVILGQLLLSYTPFGTWIKSVGSNETSARVVGLNTARLKILVFVISGVLAALAGIMMTAWAQSIYPNSGTGLSLEAIAAVILGGIPFTGGRGTIVGAAIGAIIIGVVNDLIVLLGLPALWEYIFVALVLVVAGLQARGGVNVK
ncbi:MAG: ABC transporter permease [Actinobacteria bacterium]|jgi:ribose/xylose/arabinose/galactoside ABC-type transport system permease subunit|nr:ABC transporter permease [Actinomycetota bacterium]MCL5885966.1 ABC transporter permease [Actinomycetota bacterium]